MLDPTPVSEVPRIRVGRSDTTVAQYYVETQEEVDDLLEALVQLRQPTLRARPEQMVGVQK